MDSSHRRGLVVSDQDHNEGRFGGGMIRNAGDPGWNDFRQGQIQRERDAAEEAKRQERERAENAKWLNSLTATSPKSGGYQGQTKPTASATNAGEGLYKLFVFGVVCVLGWYGLVFAQWASLTGWWAMGAAGVASLSGWRIISWFKSPLIAVFAVVETLMRWALGIGIVIFVIWWLSQ